MVAPQFAQMGDFMKMFGDFKAPQVDFNGVLAAQRRNIEAFTAAGQVVAEGLQAVARRQAEVVRSGVEGALKASKELMTSGSPETSAAKQADFARNMFENTFTHLREVSETATKSGFEAFDILNRRAAETLEEVSSAAGRRSSSANTNKKK